MILWLFRATLSSTLYDLFIDFKSRSKSKET